MRACQNWPATNLIHGASRGSKLSPEYMSWKNAKARCFNPNQPNYHLYGGRGITMCHKWKESFAEFLKDMGQRPLGTSLDRIDNNGNYEPGNCRWATKSEQSYNTSRNHRIGHAGKLLTVTEWAKLLKVSTNTIWARIRKGLPTEKVLSQSVQN